MTMAFEPMCLNDFQSYAERHLPKTTYEYFRAGASDEVTLQDNIQAFKRWKIRPRMLRDTTQMNLSTTILGNEITFPVCISPTAQHGLAHRNAELATASGAKAAGIVFTQSIHSTETPEEVSITVPTVLRFRQLYVFSDRNLTLEHVRRAEDNGFKALVLTLDAQVSSRRLANLRNQIVTQPLPDCTNRKLPTLQADEMSSSSKYLQENRTKHLTRDQTLDGLKWLMSVTRLPLIVKGIVTGEDAKIVVDCGVSGIIVSNHGGRQLDTVFSTIDYLPEVVAAVNGRCEVYMDGGVRNGTDIFKALALGAKAVFIGRPVAYALAYNGVEGVTEMLQILKEEFQTTMALVGCSSMKDISREMVMHETVHKLRL